MTEELAVALGAGILAAVNPCGFALLPAYLSLLIIDQDGADRRPALRRAVVSTAAMTVGFVAVFAVFGLVIAPLAAGVQRYLPAVTVVAGVALVIAGCWLLAGRSLPTFGWSPQGRRPSRRVGAMVGFGVTYALASLTCTIGPFLAIVVGSFRAGSAAEGLLLFVAYGVGMGLLVGTAAVAVALARTTLLDRMRGVGRVVPRLAGTLLVLVGGYVAYYGWWELRVLGGSDADDPVIMAAADVQRELATAVQSLGIGGWLLVGAALTLIGLAAKGIRRRRSAVR